VTSTAKSQSSSPRSRPLLERVGVRSLERRIQRGAASTSSDGVIHLLDEGERAALRRIERTTVARAAIAGALSALVCALAELLVIDVQDTAPVTYWGVVGAAAAVASIVEIGFLSWDSLRAVHAMSVAAGVLVDEAEERHAVITSLARAALEVPNPPESMHGLDPYKETPRPLLVVIALAYKLKVSATNAVLKLLVRRALGRAALRAYLVPFVALPVTAAWNAWVCSLVLKEARVRIFGPSLARDVVNRLLPPEMVLTTEMREALPRAIGSCVVRSADVHPNLEELLRVVVARTGRGPPPGVDDSRAFLASLPKLTLDEGLLVRRLLRVAAVIDGRVARRERALLREAAAALGAVEDEVLVDEERARMVKGEPLALP
jgi:hypothetical protein